MSAAEVIADKASRAQAFGGMEALDADGLAEEILDGLKAAGYAVVELPKPLPGRVAGEFPRWELADVTVISDTVFNEVLFDGFTLEPSDARELALRLLAAADAAEAIR